MKSLITADWHITERNTLGIENLYELRYEKLKAIRNYALDCKVENFILAGDTFDSYDVTPKLINDFIDFIKPLIAKVNLIIMTGNHDYHRDGVLGTLSRYNRNRIEVVYEPRRYEFGPSERLLLIPWCDYDIIKRFIKDNANKDTMTIGHAAINQFPMSSTFNSEGGKLDPKDFNSSKGRFIMGHFHIPSLRKTKNVDIRYVGSPYPIDFGESDCEQCRGFLVCSGNKITTVNLDKELLGSTRSLDYKTIRLEELKLMRDIDVVGCVVRLNYSVKSSNIIDVNKAEAILKGYGALCVYKNPVCYVVDESDLAVVDGLDTKQMFRTLNRYVLKIYKSKKLAFRAVKILKKMESQYAQSHKH